MLNTHYYHDENIIKILPSMIICKTILAYHLSTYLYFKLRKNNIFEPLNSLMSVLGPQRWPYPRHMHSCTLSSGITSNQNHSLPSKNFSEKLPRTPGPSTHLRMPLRKSYRRNSQVQSTKHSRRHTAAISHQRLYNTSTPSPTLNLARDTW